MLLSAAILREDVNNTTSLSFSKICIGFNTHSVNKFTLS